MDKKDFQFDRQAIYISLSALVRALTHIGVSLWQGGFYSLLLDATNTFCVCPSILFIGIFYYPFTNRFINLYLLKHFNRFLWSKINSQSKHCTYACLDQLLGILFNKILFNSVPPMFQTMYPQVTKPNARSSQSSAPHSDLLLYHTVSSFHVASRAFFK